MSKIDDVTIDPSRDMRALHDEELDGAVGGVGGWAIVAHDSFSPVIQLVSHLRVIPPNPM